MYRVGQKSNPLLCFANILAKSKNFQNQVWVIILKIIYMCV